MDAFLHEAESASLVAVGTSATPLGHKQVALGLNRLPIANGGRVAEVFETGMPHFNGDVGRDERELIGIKRDLRVRSQLAVPLEIAGARRGVLSAQSTQADFFAERDLPFLAAVSRWVGNAALRAELAQRATAAALEQGRRMAADELVTVLAHDLRNCLAPIRGRVDLMRRHAFGQEYSAILKDTDQLRTSVDRLGTLVDELLDIARIDQGLFDVRPEPLDLSALVTDSAAALASAGTTIQVDAPEHVRAVADSARIRQAIDNLLANAAQHAPVGTLVWVRVFYDVLGSHQAAVVEVTDMGTGIDPAVLPRLFDRYVRSSKSIGLGLGLFLARHIAEAHGGRLELVSSSWSGTQFTFQIPSVPMRPTRT